MVPDSLLAESAPRPRHTATGRLLKNSKTSSDQKLQNIGHRGRAALVEEDVEERPFRAA
jgi:hypothetical protein